MLETLNTSSTTLVSDQTIPLGSVSAKSNNNASLNGNGIELNRVGYFDVKAQFVLVATSASIVTVQMYVDENAVDGAFASVTATEGATVTLNLEKVVKIVPTIENTKATVTYKVSTGSTLTNAVVNVVQLY